ncbi:MAG: lipopolysaccharide assembly protein LapA domain-containing protein [Nitrospira sp.]|nr:lipopolysaccharide assembly protein LapA domain-containing protein [Nitrospira sp.]MCP9464533.1 lipopolysaccharide assembly protein LapA domain-containing protein [Nitrospira sp.]
MPTLLVALLFAILIALFALQNTAVVHVRLLAWDYETSLVLIILGSATVGSLLTFIASLGPRIRRAREIRRLEETVESQGERIRQLEATLAQSAESEFPGSAP